MNETIPKTLKPVTGWRDGARFDGWNEYKDALKDVYAQYEDKVPYDVLLQMARLLDQIPRVSREHRDAVIEVINACEKAGTAQSQMAAQMTCAYPSQIGTKTMGAKAKMVAEHPNGKFRQMGYAWEWIEQ